MPNKCKKKKVTQNNNNNKKYKNEAKVIYFIPVYINTILCIVDNE
jgi:hypothetical protein